MRRGVAYVHRSKYGMHVRVRLCVRTRSTHLLPAPAVTPVLANRQARADATLGQPENTFLGSSELCIRRKHASGACNDIRVRSVLIYLRTYV